MWISEWPYINENYTAQTQLLTIRFQNVCFHDIIDTWTARYCDVILTDYSDAVSIDTFIGTVVLLAKIFRHGGLTLLGLLLHVYDMIEIDHSCVDGWRSL